MNKILLLAGVAAVFSFSANAAEFTPYVSAKIKYVDMSNDIELYDEDELYEYTYSTDIDDKVFGGSVAAGVATKLPYGSLRLEAEYSRNADAENKESGIIDEDETTITMYDLKMKLESQAFMANMYYDFDTNTKLTPYIGGGIGMAKLKAKLSSFGESLGSVDDTTFAWQLGAGVAYAATDHVTFDAGYRYADYGDFSKDDAKVDVSAHEFYLGARYAF